jgi:dUTP pyrophosphatase
MITVHKIRPDAVLPSRAHPEDTGFDVTLLEKDKTLGDVTFYKTGIRVAPPQGMYLDLVARSSISKTGYVLANGVGIIDRNYRGEVLVALRKVDPTAPDLDLPCRLAQLVPRAWHDVSVAEVPSLDPSETDRAEGGFGSTTQK